MSKKTVTTPGTAMPRQGGRSIGRRLTTRLFFRMLGIFIGLNIFICVITAAGCVIYSETRLEAAVANLDRSGGQISEDVLRSLSVEQLDGTYEYGYRIPRGAAAVLPEGTAGYNRWINLYAANNLIDSGIEYNLFYTPDGDTVYRLGVNLTGFFEYFCIGFGILHIWELVTLIVKSRKNSKLIHRSLDPIWDLTRAAESLGRVSEKRERGPDMSALKGALDQIDISRLDTRIELDSTQRELRGLAAAINEMLDRVRDAYSAQIRFVSDASHELRTPISVIQGYANLLDRWGKNDEKTLQEGIDAIRSEADSMKSLVEQLLFLARSDNNTISPEPELIDFKELCEEVVQETRLIDTTHEFRGQAEEAPVYVDRQLIKQAVRILVDNAIKYTDPGGTITLRSGLEDGRAFLSVTDTGVGISEELLPRIFDRFVRADESRTRSSGGAGLGLSIAQWIVSRHGGHLDVLSREGVGTRMTITLPAPKKQANAPAAALKHPPSVPTVPTVPSVPSVPTVSTVPTVPTVPSEPTLPQAPEPPPGAADVLLSAVPPEIPQQPEPPEPLIEPPPYTPPESYTPVLVLGSTKTDDEPERL